MFGRFCKAWSRVASVFGETKCSPIERKVDVFRESLDYAVRLREGCASLEDEWRLILECKEVLEDPAHPEILLDWDWRDVPSGRRLAKQVAAFLGWQLGYDIHRCP